jgi:hypothetical protein
MSTLSPDRIDDHLAIVGVSISYASGIDRRDWERYREVFTQQCEFDFSSFSGTPPTTLTNQQWADNVRSLNGNFDATQHIMTNHDITFLGPDEAVGVNELQAQHFFTAESMASFGREAAAAWCFLGGHYTNSYARSDGRWRIARCRLDVRWRTGDETVFALARARNAA